MELMSGNEAIAQGAWEAGARVGVAYPGTPSTETLEEFARKEGVYAEWCVNEKVAVEVGIGASAAGARVLATMKHVGVNVAADPLFTAAYTGVGGGIVIHGRLLAGPNAIAGEWGHNPLPWRQPADGLPMRCYCGLDDCIETFLSGPGWAERSGLGLDAGAIALAASQGVPAAQQALARYAEQLARSLASVINLLDPEVIVLGGGLSNIGAIYSLVPALLSRHVFSDQVNTRLVPARHGDSSGVRGAAWLWP